MDCPASRKRFVRLISEPFLFASFLLLASRPLLAQGTLTTTDGLRLSLGSTGSISSLQLNGVERRSSAITSGFVYRELPTSVSNTAPNGSFESGSSGHPTSWSWTGGTGGTWTWDTSTASAGTHSMKMYISGTSAKRSPLLSSSQFTVIPNAVYTFSCQVKTSGLSRGLDFYLLEQDTSGNWVQRGLSGKSGTTPWSPLTLTYTSGPKAAKAYFKVEENTGYGTAWIDDVRFTAVFGSRVPVAFGGTVTSSSGVLTQTASTNGLTLSAKFTSVGSAIRVDATLTDTTGTDRPIELGFRLPLSVAGWSWEQNFVTSTPIEDGKRYENLDTVFGQQTHSMYPFATVRNSSAAFSLATPMVAQMNRFSYDTSWGLRVTWDLGLSAAATKTKSKANVTFWIFTEAPKWGLRSTAEKYYALNPGPFTSTATLNGAWELGSSLTSVSGWQDFGWGLDEAENLDFDNANGLLAMHYVDPSGWFRSFPTYAGGSQPPYSVLISALTSDAATGTGTTVDGAPVKTMAQAVINSSPYNESSLYQVTAKPYFWYGSRQQIYPVLPDANIPAPSTWSVLTKYCVDGRVSSAQSTGNHINGIFLDDITSTFGNVENHRRSLWAYSDRPLTFSYTTRRVMQYDGFSTSEFLGSLASYLHGKGLKLMNSMNAGMYTWYASAADIVGGECDVVDPVEKAYVRRTLGYGKRWTNLWVNNKDSTPPSAATVLGILRQALALGYFPGFAGEYWSSSTSYNRDRPLFKKYVPIIRTIVAAGWRPVNYATVSDPAIYVERFDNQTSNVFYLTAQNSSTGSKSFSLTMDGAGLKLSSSTITVQELLAGNSLSVSRSGSNATISDSLAAGETVVYKVTDTGSSTGSTSGSGGGTNTPTTGVPTNGNFESGSGSPTGWTLGTSSTDGSWTWDVSSSGNNSAKLVVPGTSLKHSPILKSATFSLSGGRSHVLSVSMNSQGAGGNYPPTVYVVELDSSGAVLTQHGIPGDFGSSGWDNKSLGFTTSSSCVKAYVYANIYDGYGTVYVDNVNVE